MILPCSSGTIEAMASM